MSTKARLRSFFRRGGPLIYLRRDSRRELTALGSGWGFTRGWLERIPVIGDLLFRSRIRRFQSRILREMLPRPLPPGRAR